MNFSKRLSYFVTTLLVLVLVGGLSGYASEVSQDIISGTKKVIGVTKKGTVKAGKVTYKTGRKVTSRSKKIGKNTYGYSKKGVKATTSRTRKTVRTAVTGRSYKTRRP